MNDAAPSLAADNLAWLSANQLLAAYRSRRLSPVEVTRAVLTRITRLDPKLNAFCLVDPEAALEAATASERRWAAGTPAGLLDGVPTSIKDIVATRGWPTLRGSRTIDPAQDWDQDGPAVARLREDGAVLLGKTTTPEFAMSPVTESPLTGVTRNPWDTSRVSGGSSGGAAAAVAAGLGPLALGTDAGGSIRIPASFCGIFGLKVGGGRVPMYPPTPLATLVGFGPMTRTVADAALMLSVISRPDPRDWSAGPYDPTPYHEHLEDAEPAAWRIAWAPTLGRIEVDPEVAAITAEAASAFGEIGARLETVDQIMDDPLPTTRKLRQGLNVFAFRHLGPREFALMDPALVEMIEESRRQAGLESYLEAEMERAALGRRMIAFHQDYDLLLTPTLAVAAFATGRRAPEGHTPETWTGLVSPFNLTRQPAATVPCGFTRAGMPVGLQIVGPPHRELLVLQAARAFEKARPWADRRPDLESA
jgi:aspartyl-tRNA(Asn)/glutamyl-tRNA(Gln) amidotransferase subunit A